MEAKPEASPQLPKKSVTASTLTSTGSSEAPASVSFLPPLAAGIPFPWDPAHPGSCEVCSSSSSSSTAADFSPWSVMLSLGLSAARALCSLYFWMKSLGHKRVINSSLPSVIPWRTACALLVLWQSRPCVDTTSGSCSLFRSKTSVGQYCACLNKNPCGVQSLNTDFLERRCYKHHMATFLLSLFNFQACQGQIFRNWLTNVRFFDIKPIPRC